MTKRKRWLIGIPLGVLVALVLFFVFVFDWNWLKGVAEDQASAALEREVEITGDLDVDLDLSLTPRITVTGLWIANAPWAGDEPFAEIRSAAAELDLLAALGGDVVLHDVDVDGPTLRLERSSGGQGNWAVGDQQESEDDPSIPVIGALDVSDATVHYVDHATGAQRTATLPTIEGAVPREGDLRLAASGEFDGQPLSLTASAGSRAVLTDGGDPVPFALDLEIGGDTLTIAGSGTNLPADGNAAIGLEVSSARTLLPLLGIPAQDLPDLTIDAMVTRAGDEIRVEDLDATFGASDLHGSGTVAFGDGPLRITGDLRSSLVDLDQARTLWATQQAGSEGESDLAAARQALEEAQSGTGTEEEEKEGSVDPDLPFSFSALPPWTVDLAYQADHIRGAEIEIRDLDGVARLEDKVPFLRAEAGGRYAGQEIVVDARLGPDGDAAAKAPYPIRVEARAGSTRLAVEGTVEQPEALTGIDIRFDAASSDLNQILAAAGFPAPAIPAFEVVGHLRQRDRVWSIEDLFARVADSQVQGTASLDRGVEPPRLTADLRSSRLIAADFMPEGATDDGDGADDGPQIVIAEGLNLEALPDLDLDVSFSGDYVEVPDFRFEPLRFDLTIVDKIPVLTAAGEGVYRDAAPASFEATLGSERFLEAPNAPYPVDVRLTAGETSFEATGTVAEPASYTGLDVEVALEGPDLDQAGKVLQIPLPDSPPYRLSGSLTHQEQRWSLDPLEGVVGESDLAGTFSIDLGQDRPTIVADLRSRDLNFEDLAPLVGGGSDEERDAGGGLFSDEPFEVPDLRAMDARVTFASDNVDAQVPIEEMTAELTLEDGSLRLEPLQFRMGGGELVSTIVLDARPKPIDASIDMTFRGIDLQAVLRPFDIDFSELETQQEGQGTLFGRIDLQTSGDSIQAMAAAADGKAAALMAGGWVNALIVEALGVDIGEALGLVFDDEESATMVPVRCFIANFVVEGGVMRTEALVLDTEDSKVTGAGQIDLGEETLDIRLKAQARDPSVLTAGTPIRIHGPITEPNIEVLTEELAEKGLAAAALGVVLPLVGAVIPFIETGDKVPSNCGPLLEQAKEAAGAPDAAD